MPYYRFWGIISGPGTGTHRSSPRSAQKNLLSKRQLTPAKDVSRSPAPPRGSPAVSSAGTPKAGGDKGTSTPSKAIPSRIKKSAANSFTWVPRVYYVSEATVEKQVALYGSLDNATFALWVGTVGHELKNAYKARAGAQDELACQVWHETHPLSRRFSAAQASTLLKQSAISQLFHKGLRVFPRGSIKARKDGLWLEREELEDYTWVEVCQVMEKTRNPATATVDNPYLTAFREHEKHLPPDYSRLYDPLLDEARRSELWDVEDPTIIQEYCWAIPDGRALGIIAAFGPIIEIAAGSGYWAHLLSESGVDIIACDAYTYKNNGNGNHHYIKKGGTELANEYPDRTLMLCYPDDYEESEESVGLNALQAYEGDTVIHIGELYPHSIVRPHAWGRTSGPDFQVHLASTFHMVLCAPLPCWSTSKDTISVWKRTRMLEIDGDQYASIPADEQVNVCVSSSKYAHLLEVKK